MPDYAARVPESAERPSTPGPGRPRDAAIDERVLDATRQLVEEAGYHQVTMEAIAARARVGKATLYRRWPNKASVISAAVAEGLAPHPPERSGNWREDAVAYLGEIVAMLTLLGDPSVVGAALAERGEVGQREIGELLRVRFGYGEAILADAVAAGHLPEGTSVGLVVEQWSAFVLYRVIFARRVPSERELRALVDSLRD